MSRNALSILLLAGLLFGLAGCRPPLASPAASDPNLEQTLSPTASTNPTEVPRLPITGKDSSGPGATVLLLEATPGTERFSANTGEPVTDYFSIVAINANTGEPVKEFAPIQLGGGIAYGFSQDRSQLAVLSKGMKDCPGYCLRILDLAFWKEMVEPIQVENSHSVWFTVPTFDPTSDTLPLYLNRQSDTVGEMILVSRSERRVIRRTSLPANIFQAVTTPQGNLALRGLHTVPSGETALVYTALLDGTDLSLLWERAIEELPMFVDGGGDHNNPTQGWLYEPAAVFTPDGSKLYIVAADRPLLLTVDFEKQAVDSTPIQPEMSWFERFLTFTAGVVQAKGGNGIMKTGVLSPDGRYLYVVGQETRMTEKEGGDFEMRMIPLGLQVIDTRDGALVREVKSEATQAALSLDGKTLLLKGWGSELGNASLAWTDVLDLSSWEVIQRLEGTASPTWLLDGSPAWVVVKENSGLLTGIDLYRPGDSAPRFEMTRSGYLDWIAIP